MYLIYIVLVVLTVLKEGYLQQVADSPDISISEFLSRANAEFLPKCSCIGTFTSNFINAAYSSEMLRNTFDFSDISPATLRNSLYDQSSVVLKDYGFTNPFFYSNYAVQPITDYLESLTTPMMLQIYANSMGKFLDYLGILREDNAVQLALEYANKIEETAKNKLVKDNLETKMQSLIQGLRNFAESLGALSQESLVSAAYIFANEVKQTGNMFRSGGNLYV
ncbi:hypothetical protein CDAR_464771 [Caerostris darwini]|uniref:Uncharacterized protein n=1 Tax=Caerostris darwini TaxID=1538125 RepID=A0AAV4RB35_9ARAC|nr:hypothetical protein CDAR_464771 [Caerostris darwini]